MAFLIKNDEPADKKQYRVVCYMRIDMEEDGEELLTYDEAESEANSLRLMQPENEYRIEKVELKEVMNEPRDDGKGVPMESDE